MVTPKQPTPLPIIVIEPSRGLARLKFKELWNYRDLLLFLGLRDVSVRYKQTILGAAWAVLQPILTMIVFTIFFGRLAGVPSDGVPYPLFAFAALLPWQYFATTLTSTTGSLVNNTALISKVYFPRVMIPLASMFPPAVDFLVSFIFLIGLMFYYRAVPPMSVLCLPAFMILAVVATFGAGLWCGAMNVRYRDVRHIVPVLVQFGMFISPVAYPTHIVPAAWQPLYAINPMVGVIEGFRWALLATGKPLPLHLVGISALTASILFVTGLVYFRYTERTFADII
jgi:lipopolysaccharide transport system permease protein